MVIAYETKRAADDAARPEGIPALPALDDDGEIATGASALRDHLQSLRDLMADWHRFQPDACCVEDGGSGCQPFPSGPAGPGLLQAFQQFRTTPRAHGAYTPLSQ